MKFWFAGMMTVVCCLRALGGPSTNGLVLAYGFEEGHGVTVVDQSGNGNHGTLNGAVPTGGRFGGALAFDGVGARVIVPDSPSLHITSAITLEAWVNPTRIGSWRDVIYKEIDDNFYLTASSNDETPAFGGEFASEPLYGADTLDLNRWTHLAGTFDGTVMRLFVDGIKVADQFQSGNIQPSTGVLSIGGDGLFGQFFEGRIDEVRIYNRALTVNEIRTDMLTPVVASEPDPEAPSVSIASPVAGAVLSHVSLITVTATDNVRVAEVDLFADGIHVGSSAQAPYSIGWNTTAVTNGIHSLTAVARDFFGNQATSAVTVVTTVNPAFVNEVVVPDITSATTMAFLPDGRMLVGELTETVWVVVPGSSEPEPEPFLQLDSSELFGEQGLMDILVDPGFVTNGYYYVFYTRGNSGSKNHNRLSRFTAVWNSTVLDTELVLWEDPRVAEAEHHGGGITFGPEGMLYFTMGEQFASDDAPQLDTYRGKVMRIRPDGTIPEDNPFYDGDGPNLDEIWGIGLRNPFRLSFDPVSGRLFEGEVGGNDQATAVEEINVIVRGANYGWPLCEGNCGLPGVTSPLYSYPHSGRDACVTGGFVYRGAQFPSEYQGSYFFGDYVQNTIKRLIFDTNGAVAAVLNFWPADGATDQASVGDPVKLIEGPDGAIYYVDIGFNDAHEPNPASIRRIRYNISNRPPVALVSASPMKGVAPLVVAFSSADSIDPEGGSLTRQWSFGDGTISSEVNPVHTYLNQGSFTARLTISDGVNTTLSSNLVITVGTPPDVQITSPANGTTFRAGDVLVFTGTASDREDGILGPSAFTWNIRFHHDGHIHPGGVISGSRTATLPVPLKGHDFTGSTSYEVLLSVVDSAGLSSVDAVTVFPEKVNLHFDSLPSGFGLDVDGIRKTTPFTLDDVIGFQHELKAPEQTVAGTTYYFQSWSDGGAQYHSIVVPELDGALSATFGTTLPAPVLQVQGWHDGRIEFSFATLAGRSYRVQWNPGLSVSGWSTFSDVQGTGEMVDVSDDTATGGPRRSYRVLLQSP